MFRNVFRTQRTVSGRVGIFNLDSLSLEDLSSIDHIVLTLKEHDVGSSKHKCLFHEGRGMGL